MAPAVSPTLPVVVASPATACGVTEMVCGTAAACGVTGSLEAVRLGLRSGSGGGTAASFFATAGAARLAFAGAWWRDFATAIAGAKHAKSTSNDRACAVKRFISSNGTGYNPGKAGQDVPRAGEPRRRGHCIVPRFNNV